MSQPKIRINGILVSDGAAMTIRVALESFRMSLLEDGLGDDQQGKDMVTAYLNQVVVINHAMGQAEGGAENDKPQ